MYNNPMAPGTNYEGRVIITRLKDAKIYGRLSVRNLICVFEADLLLPGGCAGDDDVVLICTPENYGEFMWLTGGDVT